MKLLLAVVAFVCLLLAACAKHVDTRPPDAPQIGFSMKREPCHVPLLDYERPGDNCEAQKP